LTNVLIHFLLFSDKQKAPEGADCVLTTYWSSSIKFLVEAGDALNIRNRNIAEFIARAAKDQDMIFVSGFQAFTDDSLSQIFILLRIELSRTVEVSYPLGTQFGVLHAKLTVFLTDSYDLCFIHCNTLLFSDFTDSFSQVRSSFTGQFVN
ncbi:hypothetical protein, partial [Enterobacter hormaechei]